MSKQRNTRPATERVSLYDEITTKIIAELEDAARGPYCGSLAWIAPDGLMDSSILIRSTAFRLENDRWLAEVGLLRDA